MAEILREKNANVAALVHFLEDRIDVQNFRFSSEKRENNISEKKISDQISLYCNYPNLYLSLRDGGNEVETCQLNDNDLKDFIKRIKHS